MLALTPTNPLHTPGAAIHAGPPPNNPEQIQTSPNTAEHLNQIELLPDRPQAH